MPSSTVNEAKSTAAAAGRVARLKEAVQAAKPGVCAERALIWTAYHRDRRNRKKDARIRMAEALAAVLERKSATIYPDELIVGNFTSRRVGGSVFPELHGVPVLLDLFKFRNRETNPLEISTKDMRALLGIVPFWVFRFLAFKAFASPIAKLRFIADQLKSEHYLINESGGISHFAPDYEKLVKIGTSGLALEAAAGQAKAEPGSEAWNFYEGAKIALEALARFGERYAELAARIAREEKDVGRRAELLEIERSCRQVPRRGARSFREAVQSIFLAQIALNHESLDNAVSPGRMDRYLYPYYAADLARGILDRKGAKEILSCFSIKMSEIIPVFSGLLTNFHGGMFNGQVVTVGGLDRAGNDSTNELSLVFLEIMDELRMRQPNYHARLHPGSPTEYVEKIMETLARGSASPALYNDLAIIKAMTARGYSIEDARDYTAVGCVEPVSQGKSFSSTDAAIFNAPICLEMALNGGRRFHRLRHSGARSPMPSTWKTMEDAKAAFEAQLRHGLTRLARDARAIETANARYHPTPLTSSLIEGCLETGRCSTKGGATYNFSGLQCVGPVDAGDALYALERAFAKEGPPAFVALARDCAKNLADEKTRIRLKNAEKYGNDDEGADAWTRYVVDAYVAILESLGPNTRGGPYVAGLYSVTAHEYFGRVTGALPNGRRRGEPFSSGISAENGMDRLGPTAMLNSAARIDYSRVANGVNLNLRFDPRPLSSKEGPAALRGLVKAFFDRGGMQVQANVIDTRTLIAARDDPSAYPNLLVRVSGYSSYFNDLTPAMKDEIIKRSEHRC